MEVIKLNNENFESEVKQSNQVVLVDFYADWCGPCKMMAPVIDKIAEESDGRFKVCKLNVDDAQDIAVSYDVMSIPTLILFKDGTELNRLVGLQDKKEVLDMINYAL